MPHFAVQYRLIAAAGAFDTIAIDRNAQSLEEIPMKSNASSSMRIFAACRQQLAESC
jgi:hypothetical protein